VARRLARIALAFGAGAAVLVVGTAWPTGIVRVIPPLLHGYADVIVTVALILLSSRRLEG
jgi:hypothetical protein